MATKKTFNFALGDTVRLATGDEKGTVIGRAHYLDANPSYLVRYVAAGGRLTEAWWNESALSAESPSA